MASTLSFRFLARCPVPKIRWASTVVRRSSQRITGRAGGGLQFLGKGGVPLPRPGPQGPVHVAGYPSPVLAPLGFWPVRPTPPAPPGLGLLDEKRLACQQARGVGNGHPGPSVAIVNGHNAHKHSPFVDTAILACPLPLVKGRPPWAPGPSAGGAVFPAGGCPP